MHSPVEVGADLVGLAGTESVALRAPSLEKTSTLASVTCDSTCVSFSATPSVARPRRTLCERHVYYLEVVNRVEV